MITMTIRKTNVEEDFDLTSDKYYAIPMVVKSKSTSHYVNKEELVVITSYDGCLFFREGAHRITFGTTKYLKNTYEFVRFLTKDESVIFTGER